jgi:hypothetical protein
MDDDALGVRDALYSGIQARVMAHIEAKKAEIASNLMAQEQVEEPQEEETEYYAIENIPESIEVLMPTQAINEAKKEESPWRMDKDREGTGYHEIHSVKHKTALVNGVPKHYGMEHDGRHHSSHEHQHEAEKMALDLADRGHTCTHHCPQGYVKAVVQPAHMGFNI